MLKALYPGKFDPPTKGHLEIIRRSSLCFDFLIVGIGMNYNKPESILSVEERKTILEEETSSLSNVEIIEFKGLVSAFAKKNGVSFFIRGLRSSQDLMYEMERAEVNRKFSGVETLFLMADVETRIISSSLVKELAMHQAPLKDFLPKKSEEMLKHHIQKEI